MLFDSHFHVDEDESIPDLFEAARQEGLAGGILAGTDPEDSRRYAAEAARTQGLFATAGIHPHDAARCGPGTDWLPPLIEEFPSAIVAIGEIGLDYYYEHAPRAAQREVFAATLQKAVELGLPAVLHCRDAYEDCAGVLHDCGPNRPRFLVHSFTGTPAWAEEVLALGAYFSFNGIVTFRKADNVREALRHVPLHRVLLGTDSPYLAPSPHRGKRNRPQWVQFVAETVAREFDMDSPALIRQTTRNALDFFGLDETDLALGR